MNLFGIGGMELVLIVVIALLVLGPERLPEVARKTSFYLRRLRRVVLEVNRQLREELELEDLDDLIRETRQTLDDPLGLKLLGAAPPPARRDNPLQTKPVQPAASGETIEADSAQAAPAASANGDGEAIDREDPAFQNTIAPPALGEPALDDATERDVPEEGPDGQ